MATSHPLRAGVGPGAARRAPTRAPARAATTDGAGDGVTRSWPTKRDLIVEEAARLFYERGTGVGIDTLIDEIGIAKMTLYKHFPAKADLIAACLRHVDARYRERLVLQGEIAFAGTLSSS